ncbi:MAG: FtsX-like permease family protein [Thermodesulfobacteriota bacterium]|nr:FtsX-like permease family protein [Thermodesulfobacteriota bacterium]
MLIKLAFFNLWRNSRRTLLTLSAMVISAAMLILALGIFSGMFADMLASTTELYHGHIVISKRGYQDKRDLYTNFSADSKTLNLLKKQPYIQGISTRLRVFGLLSHREETRPAELLGVEFSHEAQVTTLKQKLIAGRFPDNFRPDEGIIGSTLARRLKIAPGQQLVFVTQAADGSIGNALFTVCGIFSSGDQIRDASLALVDQRWLQELMALPAVVHEIALRIDQPLLAADQATVLQKLLDSELTLGVLDVMDWGELLPQMQEAIASYDISRMILVLILYSAAGVGVLNTFYMSVMERSHEFGILLAIGMPPTRLRHLVLLESLILSVISVSCALLLGGILTMYMQQVGIDLSDQMGAVTYAGGTIAPHLRAVHELGNYMLPAISLLMVSLLASYFPARRASNLQPVDVIRGL